ncbi:MAG: D-amino-acid transaminase [Alphaproteobacteria bacterium]
MPRFAYVNGRYLPHPKACVHVEDRGYQFGDGVYEVVAILDGCPIDEALHLDRLERSLRELRIAMPMTRAALTMAMRELVRRNGIRNGLVYMQVTRGVAPRDHKFPTQSDPSLVMTTKRMSHERHRHAAAGVSVITIPDIRWKRCDIKSVSLLPNCLGKQQAVEAGAYEAWQVDDEGLVTEGTSSNAWIVTQDGHLLTRATGNEILSGITRASILRLAEEEGLAIEERPFSVEEAKAAREAFLSSATSFVTPVVRIDGAVLGDGRPGPLTRRLTEWYWSYSSGGRA